MSLYALIQIAFLILVSMGQEDDEIEDSDEKIRTNFLRYYIYLDLRWDDVEHYKRNPHLTPHDHGLHIAPGIYVARKKIKKIYLWSGVDQNFYIRHPKYGDTCVRRNAFSRCAHYGSSDFGECNADTEHLFRRCNNGKGDHFSEFSSRKKPYLRLLKKYDHINFVFPDGHGLPDTDLVKYQNKFGNSVAKTLLLYDISERLKFIKAAVRREGNELIGIISSNAGSVYFTAAIANGLDIPHFITSSLDKGNIWPYESDKNSEDTIIKNSVVLGYEDWMIIDQLAYVIRMTGWYAGSIQMIHESGYSQRLAEQVEAHLTVELERFNINIKGKLYFNLVTRWDYFVRKENRTTDDEVTALIKEVKARTRGKALYLIKMFSYIILSKQGAQLYRLNISVVSITPRWPD